MATLVLVESPAKAKALQNYLGGQYTVLATYGHVRDIIPKASSIRVDQNFDIAWETYKDSQKHVNAITKVAKKSDQIILATDPDREGEAIAWHILTILQEDPGVAEKPYQRAIFHEVSKKAVIHAIEHAKNQLDQGLINSYRTRRSLDFLVGFHISPILWRKIPCCRSAGRVQSTALRLICERALLIDRFVPQEYWSITGLFNHNAEKVEATLSAINKKAIKKEDLASEKVVNETVTAIKKCTFKLSDIQTKTIRTNPKAPLTTSTLQQVGNKSLNWSTAKVMQVAQSLYEGVDIDGTPTGLITYMRTDSTRIAPEFIEQLRALIVETFGQDYCPKTPVTHKNTTKNAQEAHEAIRPTGMLTPQSVQRYLTKDQLALYSIIWSRTLASQMAPSVHAQKTFIITDEAWSFTFRASATSIVFKGYLAAQGESEDTPDTQEGGDLANIQKNTPLNLKSLTPNQHFTKPPAYFSEATLVQALEERGIGRPSTYAPTIQMLLNRRYIARKAKQLHPTLIGRILIVFLTNNIPRYVADDFTAQMEDTLDEIAQERSQWLPTLQHFWDDLKASVDEASSVDIQKTMQQAQELLDHLILKPHKLSKGAPCPDCKKPMSIKSNKFGFFLGCTGYPDCKKTLSLSDNVEDYEQPQQQVIGEDPRTKKSISLKKGPYGPYLELATDPVKRIPVIAQMQKQMPDIDTLSILLSLPKEIGQLNDQPITLMMGRYGPFIKTGKTLCSIPIGQVQSLTMDDVPKLIEQSLAKKAKKTS